MRPSVLSFAIGCLLGGGVMLLAMKMRAELPAARSGDRPALSRAVIKVEELKKKHEQMEEQIRENRAVQAELDSAIRTLRAERDALKGGAGEDETDEAAKGPLTEKELEKAIGTFGSQLSGIILGTKEGKQAGEALRAVLKRGGEETIRAIIGQFKNATRGLQERTVLAHVLGQSEHPVALQTLEGVLRDPDAGMMAHRVASHGLAFSTAKDIDPLLTDMARNATDLGVRANTAFGLARRGVDEGFDLYFAATDTAFEKGDPSAMQYLGGTRLLGKKAHSRIADRLLTYTEKQSVLVLILLAKATGDKEAFAPNLRKLAYDSSRPADVQQAAQNALKALGSE